jgi:hypothetical protein
MSVLLPSAVGGQLSAFGLKWLDIKRYQIIFDIIKKRGIKGA